MYACDECCVSFAAGMYMGAAQMGYAPGYGQYPALATQQGMMGTMMAPQVNMLGQPGVMAPTGVATPSLYMTGVHGGVMGVQGGIQGGMMGGVGALPQQAYVVQQTQQLQWNITQVGTICLDVFIRCLDVHRFYSSHTTVSYQLQF